MIETIADNLKTYGVLGLWTITLLYDRIAFQRNLRNVIENNTRTQERVLEHLRG